MANVQLNSDVYAHFLSFVDSPSDLLAVGLANRELLSLAEPELLYRSIRCKLGNNAVWEHLISYPTHATRVRRLELMPDHPSSSEPLDNQEQVPEGLDAGRCPTDTAISREDTIYSETLLIRAIHNMSNLQDFTWNRWVPAINKGDEEFGETGNHYTEDVWIALRNSTGLSKLKVVDYGFAHHSFIDSRSIFSSSIFALRRLTHLDLKMYYSPENPNDGENEDDLDIQLRPPRVKLERLRDMLGYCPDLEALTLSVFDWDFYWTSEGNPYTDASLVIAGLHLSNLHTLVLRDVTVRADIMVNFLNTHPKLRNISAFLSLSQSDLPEVPFNLKTCDFLQDGILPNMESLNLPARDLRQILKAVRRPSPLHTLGVVQPQDWYVPEELDHDEHYVSSLDDVWGTTVEGFEPEVAQKSHNLLIDLPNLRELTVEGLTTISQLNQLIYLTPHLEVIRFRGRQIPPVHYSLRADFLPLLSRWPRLTKFDASFLWPMGCNVMSDEIQSIANLIASVCPMLQDIRWVDGGMARITKAENGQSRVDLSPTS